METPEVFNTMKEYRKHIREYRAGLKQMLGTSRFSDATLSENAAFRSRNRSVGCVYCCPAPITRQIPQDMVVFVLEMNNTVNRIAGIGMIKNRAIVNKYKVYDNNSYNRHVYMGKMRISREEMTEEEDRMMRVFDTLCFKGAKNMKRGQGITLFPIETLYKCSKHIDLVEYIRQMFVSRRETNTQSQ
jgi:hypothetical protein